MVKIIMVGYQFRSSLLEAVKKVNKVTDGMLDFRFYNTYDVDNGLVDPKVFVQDLRSSEIVLLDVRGGDSISKLVCKELKDSRNAVIVFVGGSSDIIKLTRLGSFSFKSFSSMKEKPFLKRFFKSREVDYGTILKMRERFEKLGKKIPIGILRHARNYSLLLKYYETPSVENYYSMLLLLLKEYGGVRIDLAIPEPKVMPTMGIKNFKTEETFTSLNEYFESYIHREQPLVGILFYGGYHYDQSYPAAKLLTENIESYGYGVIPVFCSDLRYYLAIEKFFFESDKPVIEALIDLLWFRLAGGPIGGDHRITLNILSKLDVPILHGIHLSSKTVDEWLDSKHGICPIETVTSVVLPELDGRNEPIVTHAVRKKLTNGVKLEEYVAIEDRVEKLAKRAVNWVKLRNKKNIEKKIAIILYNYPPGEENIGKASYLNVFESLSRILKALRDRGYNVTSTPSGEELKNFLVSRGIVNSGEWIQTSQNIESLIKVSLERYFEWLKKMPDKPSSEVLREWGPPPGELMTCRNSMIIPGVIFGNVFVGLQPSRGIHEDPSKIYHDKDLPPHHQYVAFYKWLKEEFKADAVIHLGTHGTLEFLPGKEVGLSAECFPDILIDDLPNIYVYHAVNASESSIAKRRSYALIVNHSSPPVTVSSLHGEFQEIERLIIEYFDALQYNRERAEELSKKVLSKARNYDLGESVEEIYDTLEEYKRSLIPKGLHVIRDNLSEDEILDYLTFLARYDRGEIKSLHRLFVESEGLSYEEILENPHKRDEYGKTYAEILNETEDKVRKLIEKHIIKGGALSQKHDLSGEEIKSLHFLREVYDKIQQSDEINAVLNALEGRFIHPGPGGDFIRTPQIFPTGRNTYQLDPTNIPTETAMERGRRIAEKYIEKFYREHGRYPRAVSVVLWAFETMKTGGETVAAIFHLLGVKPIWKSIYIRDLEVVPLSELKRPRIDVIVTICGIFRDTFYNIVELLDRAVKRVADLKEPEEMNYVKANIMQAMAEHGESAKFRIFGPPEGQYATSLTSLIESSEWKSESDIVHAYLESMKFAYGEKERNVESRELLSSILSKVDIVAQIRDTMDYEITDLDHYYEFLGGLTKTVENKKGSRPLVLVADTTRELVKVEDAKEAIKRGVTTRTVNPNWLDSMLEHGYNGVTKIADRVEYMLGLSATLGGVEDWMWNSVTENIIFNKDRAERMRKENPWAFRKIISRLLEANKRGYWKAEKETLERLEEEYLKIEEILEDSVIP